MSLCSAVRKQRTADSPGVCFPVCVTPRVCVCVCVCVCRRVVGFVSRRMCCRCVCAQLFVRLDSERACLPACLSAFPVCLCACVCVCARARSYFCVCMPSVCVCLSGGLFLSELQSLLNRA